jgi:predicted nuclease of predicted toxin-antitoxin system
VQHIAETNSGIADEGVLDIANQQNRILITKDKDFGELVYRLQKVHTGIILVRLENLKPQSKAAIVKETVLKDGVKLEGTFTVIQPGVVRIRKLKD